MALRGYVVDGERHRVFQEQIKRAPTAGKASWRRGCDLREVWTGCR